MSDTLVDVNVLIDIFADDPRWRRLVGPPPGGSYLGAHAGVYGQYLLTRDSARYRQVFPALNMISPETHP